MPSEVLIDIVETHNVSKNGCPEIYTSGSDRPSKWQKIADIASVF